MFTEDKPGTPEELVLQHHGVKGMKWGVRSVRSLETQGTREFKKKFPTRAQQNREIKRARKAQRADLKNIRKNTRVFSKERRKAKVKLFRNADAATALRLTTGEKMAFSIMAVAPGSNVPLAIGLASRSLRRRSIEEDLGKG